MPPKCRKRYRVVLTDIDGVVWRRGVPLAENVEGLYMLRKEGSRIVFLTNNATRSRRLYSLLLSSIVGWKVAPRDVITSGYVLAREAARRYGSLRIYVVGEPGLVEELAEQGHVVVTRSEAEKCFLDAVAVALDTDVTYSKLSAAVKALTKCNALLLVANTDKTIPVEDGVEPGAGAILASIVTATGRSPDLVAGKPSTTMAETVASIVGNNPRGALVIGDRLDTDIELAAKMGADSLLVLTGVTPPGTSKSASYKPTYVAKTVKEYASLPPCN
jgi:4-nitrophenyl phosphatase